MKIDIMNTLQNVDNSLDLKTINPFDRFKALEEVLKNNHIKNFQKEVFHYLSNKEI